MDSAPGEFIIPLDRDQVPRRCNILRAKEILNLDVIPRFQDVDSAVYKWQQPPACILFISHRWASPTHPDPDTEQLKALKFLLRAVGNLASVYDLSLSERTKSVKTLKIHGYLQAARIISKIAQEAGSVNSALSKIGIWLDYMCLPQKNASGVDDRIPDEAKLFKQGVRGLPSLVASCDFIVSLRKEGDDYIERAWCISEICFSSFKYFKNVIVLRTDLLGQAIDNKLIYANEIPGSETTEAFRLVVDSWETSADYSGKTTLSDSYAELEIVEESHMRAHKATIDQDSRATAKWPTPFLTTPRPPLIFPDQTEFLMHIRQSLAQAPPRNISMLITMTMQDIGMSCYDINDYARCGLHILRSRMTGLLGWRVFYNDCLHRMADGKALILADVPDMDTDNWLGHFLGDSRWVWETDETVLALHAKATATWKRVHQHANRTQTTALLESMLLHLHEISQWYARPEGHDPLPLAWLLAQATATARIELPYPTGGEPPNEYNVRRFEVEAALALLYAKVHGIYGISNKMRGVEKISTFLLTAFGRVPTDPDLWISDYKDFECLFDRANY